VFSQGFFSSAQISGSPQIESIEIVGYDASDVTVLTLHDGLLTHNSTDPYDGSVNNAISADERIAIYVQNQSAQKVTLNELRVAGTEYDYHLQGDGALPVNGDNPGEYFVVLRGDDTGAAVTSTAQVGELEAGQEATIVVDLIGAIQSGRDAQFKITTSNGAIFVGTIVAGQQSG
jgi:hypothetical protein